MRFIRIAALALVTGLLGLAGYSFVRNPDVPVTQHADALGFVLANPASSEAWQSLACPHRRAVMDLVSMSIAPKLCGTPSDGGARKRAENFRSQGLGACWTLFEVLLKRDEERFRPYITKAKASDAVVADYCKHAEALIKKPG